MDRKSYLPVVLILAFIALVLAGASLNAQSFGIPPGGFTTANVCANSEFPAPTCEILTVGFPKRPQVVGGGILQLTKANTNQHGGAWFAAQQPIANGFTTSFQFQITNANLCANCSFPADGLALVIQNDPAGTGALGYVLDGQNISYGNNDFSRAQFPGLAIVNSLAIELDTHQNTDFGDPDGNHIAVQSCGPNNTSTLSPNSADHNYICANGNPAKLGLASLPAGMSLTDQQIHTITVNYLPPGNCTSSCNNLNVFFDSTLIVQATVNIATQLNLTNGTSAFIGLTAATGAAAQNANILSWTMSQWPLSPITIVQPVQTTVTNFNYTNNLNATVDYSQSGLGGNAFNGLFMQGTVQTITDKQFSDLVNNTPFQGSTCQHVDTGTGNFACVPTTDLCTTATNSTPAGANCPPTGTTLINLSHSYNLDPLQKPIIGPNYIMGKDTALNCGAAADNTCKGLVSIFTSISGDGVTSKGKTDNFNSQIFEILGAVGPSTTVSTTPPLNQGWASGPVSVNFSAMETVPSNNMNPPSPLPTVASINYSATGDDLPSPASGAITGPTGSVNVPATKQGTTVFTYFATDSANSPEAVITNSYGTVSSSSPTFTINFDLTPPTVSCMPPAVAWTINDVMVPCTASDDASGSGLVGPSTFSVQTNVPAGTETNAATIPAVTVMDVAGNTSQPAGPFGPFEVDKKAPVITGPAISPASPVFGQAVSATASCADGGSGDVICGPSGSAAFPATASTGPLNFPVDSTTGTHTFTVLAQDAVGNQSTPSAVTYTVAQATPTITWPTPAPIVFGTALSATQQDATANVAGAFVYSPLAGTVLPAGTQTLSTAFTPTDTTDYTKATATVQLMVNKAAPMITWATPAPIVFGTALSATQQNATANVAGTFVYSPQAGTVPPAGTQTLSVTFTPTDTNDYSTATATVQVVVNKATPTITWATPGAIVFGTALSAAQQNATANVPGTFAYSPAPGTVLPAGTQTLSTTFTPTDSNDYSTAMASVQLMVTKATPTITWATPAPIVLGTPLSAAQLNATANVAGVFVYNPPAGTVLGPGSQTLTTTFTPTDTNDYNSTGAQVTLLVTQPLISFSPNSINFGTVRRGGTPSILVLVSNPGTAALQVGKIGLAGNDEDNDLFSINNNCVSPVMPGKTCHFTVRFAASELGPLSLTLLVNDNVVGGPQQLPVTVTVVK